MNWLKSRLMLLAVFMAFAGVLAFTPLPMDKLPPGDQYSIGCPVSTHQNPDGTYSVTFPSGSVLTNITGKVEGVDFACDEPQNCVCYITLTSSSQIISNPDGTITFTQTQVRWGWFRWL